MSEFVNGCHVVTMSRCHRGCIVVTMSLLGRIVILGILVNLGILWSAVRAGNTRHVRTRFLPEIRATWERFPLQLPPPHSAGWTHKHTKTRTNGLCADVRDVRSCAPFSR